MCTKKVFLVASFAFGLMVSSTAFGVGQFHLQGDSVNGANQDDWRLTTTDGGSANDGILNIAPTGGSNVVNVYEDASGTPTSTGALGTDYLCIADGSSCAQVSAILGASSSGVSTVNGNNGITASLFEGTLDLSVDLLDINSGLHFTGIGANELAVNVGTSLSLSTGSLEIASGGVGFDNISTGAYVTSGVDSSFGGDLLVTEAAVEAYVGSTAATAVGDGLILSSGTIDIDTNFASSTINSTDGNGDQYWVYESAIEDYVSSYVSTNGDNLGNHTASSDINIGNSAGGGSLGIDYFKMVGGGTSGITLDVAGNMIVDGDVTSLSDARFKKQVKPLEGALEKIKAINGVSYQWKDPSKGDDIHIGVLAQNVELVYPELVQEQNGFKSVSYQGLVAPLIEAVKTLSARVEYLEQQLGQQGL